MDKNGVQDSFLWENQEWEFLNSDYSGSGSDEKSNKKVPNSNASNNWPPLPLEADAAPSTSAKRVASSGNNDGGGDQGNEEKGNGNGGEPSDHEGHLWTERERRKKTRNMFTNLHALLPQLNTKVDKSTILDEAVNYIKKLENTLSDLQRQKLERLKSTKTREAFLADHGGVCNSAFVPADAMMNIPYLAPRYPAVFKTWTSPNIALNVCGYDAHINICCSVKPGFMATIFSVLEKYKIEVLSAHISSDHNRSMYMIHARVTGGYGCQFPAEEIYKQAAREIIVVCG